MRVSGWQLGTWWTLQLLQAMRSILTLEIKTTGYILERKLSGQKFFVSLLSTSAAHQYYRHRGEMQDTESQHEMEDGHEWQLIRILKQMIPPYSMVELPR
jgi:hypothetical protein